MCAQGYVRLQNVFSPPLLDELAGVVTQAVAQQDDGQSLEDDDDYARAFKQVARRPAAPSVQQRWPHSQPAACRS